MRSSTGTAGYVAKLLLSNLLVGVVVLLLAAAGIEGYLRMTIPASSGGSIFESTLETGRYKVMKPNARIVVYGSELRTNDLGFRDHRSAIPPRPQVGWRAVVLGDSFTVSAGVDYADLWTTILENQLQQITPEAEVFNLAVGGYNIIQYALVLEEAGYALEPDLVIVAVFPFNDLSNDTYDANREDALGKSRPPDRRPWHEQLYIYRAYLHRVENRLRAWSAPAAAVAPPLARGPAQSPPGQAAVENLAALERIVDGATARGIEAVVVLLPNTHEFDGQYGDFAPFLALCELRGWDCLNLLPHFQASGERPAALRLNPVDSHPNRRYNALVAKGVAEHIAPRAVAIQTRHRQDAPHRPGS